VLSAITGSVSGIAPVGVFVKLTAGFTALRTTAKANGKYEFADLSYRIGFDDDDDDSLETVEIKPGEKITKDLKRQ
jgi:hypothetical protein